MAESKVGRTDIWNGIIPPADPRTQSWPLTSGDPTVILLVCSSYILAVYLGNRFMATRAAFKLNNILVVYNLGMVLMSGYMASLLIDGALKAKYDWFCQGVTSSTEAGDLQIATGLWWFFISKIIEMTDTMFFVLRKKTDQLSFLHLYHHVTVCLLQWIMVTWFPSGLSFFGPILNCTVHIFMYSYYGLAASSIDRRYLWWKKYITKLQLVQFAISELYFINILRIGCDYPRWMTWFWMVYIGSFLLLFTKFYISAYIQRKRLPKSANGVSHHTNGIKKD